MLICKGEDFFFVLIINVIHCNFLPSQIDNILAIKVGCCWRCWCEQGISCNGYMLDPCATCVWFPDQSMWGNYQV